MQKSTSERKEKGRWAARYAAAMGTSISIALIVVFPIISVFILALSPGTAPWFSSAATVLPRYFANTLLLMFAVGGLAGFFGVSTAWIVTMFEFPLRRLMSWALFLPLAVPAYVGAYALVDFFEFSGAFQSFLRSTFGWTHASEYVFPEIRSLGGAAIVLSAALYPYVYLLARAALREQSSEVQDVARTLGAGSLARAIRVGLPMIRPSIAAGVAIVMMETASDFGVVEYFAVQTLTTGIFSLWLEARNIGAAAQLASLILVLTFGLTVIERTNRRRRRYAGLGRRTSEFRRIPLRRAGAFAAFFWCAVPVSIGFLLPASIIASLAFSSIGAWSDDKLLGALMNTFVTSSAAAAVTMVGAIAIVYSARLLKSSIPRVIAPITILGYATPGAVLGLGLLIPLAAFDHFLADSVLAVTGHDPGLLLTGSAFAVTFAYSIRFFAIAHGAVESAMDRVSPSLRTVARSLGKSPIGALIHVYLPLMKGSLLTGLLLVFVDCTKELPATLLLQPFNFNTLATRIYERASLENLADASPAAILIMFVGSFGVVLLARTQR